MRTVNGTVINEPYQIYHPFRMLISGSSGSIHKLKDIFLIFF